MFESFEVPPELVPSDPRFASGPSLLPLDYIRRLGEAGPHLLGTSHRKSAIQNLVQEVQQGLGSYLDMPHDYEVVLGNGGATLLFDALGLGVVEKSSAHFTCGEFSQKWYRAHKLIPWISAQEIGVPFGEGITPHPVEGVDFIGVTLNETSTGAMVDTLEGLRGTEAVVAVDATSGVGQIDVDYSLIDILFFSPQKVFASEGGLFVALMSPKAIERCFKIADDSNRYVPKIMNLKAAIENSRKAQTLTTPSVSTLFYLNEQIKNMLKVGRKEVIAQSQRKANFVYEWAKKRDYLSLFIEESRYRSTTVATINLDDRYDALSLAKRLRELKVAYDIDPYRKLERNQFRIALFHNIKFSDIQKLTQIIDRAVALENA